MAGEVFDVLIVMPTHRRPDILPVAIDSVLAQTGASVTLLVVDDDAGGSARGVVERYGDDRLVYLQTPEPSGGRPGAVRNHGLAMAARMRVQARFVHFLDDDDIVPAGHYARALRAFAEHPQAGVVFGEIRSFCTFAAEPHYRARQQAQFADDFRWRRNAARVARTYTRIGAALGRPGVTQALFRLQASFGPEMFLCSGGMIRSEHVAALGGYDSDFYLMEDYEFFTRAIRRFGVHFLDAVSAYYRLATPDSLWGPVLIEKSVKAARDRRILQALRARQRAIRHEVDNDLAFFAGKVLYRLLIGPVAYRFYFWERFQARIGRPFSSPAQQGRRVEGATPAPIIGEVAGAG